MSTMYTGNTGQEATRPTVPGNLLKLAIAKARETTQEQGTLKSLVFEDKLAQNMGTTWNSPKLGALSMQAATEGEDVTNFQQLSTSNVVITPGEVALAVKFSKKSLAQWSENMALRAGRIMRDARDRKIDADIGGLGSSFTTYTLGSAGTVLTTGHLAAGFSRLKSGTNTAGSAIAAGAVSNQVPSGPIFGVFRWESLTAVMRTFIGSSITNSSLGTTSPGAPGPSDSYQTKALNSLYINRVAGVDLYGNSNLAKDASDDTVGIIGHRDSIAYIPFPHDGADEAPFERESDDGRSIQITLVSDYGFGVLDQAYAIACTFDATAPTS